MAKTLILYTTAGCHLCDRAKAVIWPQLSAGSWRLQEVEIAESDELIERYGVRIPVVAPAEGVGELGWPFDAEQLRDFLHKPH